MGEPLSADQLEGYRFIASGWRRISDLVDASDSQVRTLQSLSGHFLAWPRIHEVVEALIAEVERLQARVAELEGEKPAEGGEARDE
jgi:hypothetical protein